MDFVERKPSGRHQGGSAVHGELDDKYRDHQSAIVAETEIVPSE
jgi:hypothetical protein